MLLFASGLALNATTHASSSRLFGTRYIFLNKTPPLASDTRFLARTHSRRALGVWRRREKSSNSDSVQRSSWDSVRDGLLYHSQMTATSSATYPQVAIQPSQEVAHTTSVEPKSHDTSDLHLLRRNHSSQQWKTLEMRQLLHVPCKNRSANVAFD